MNKKLIDIGSKLLILISFLFIGIKLKNFNINLKEYINLENIIMISLSSILLIFSVIFLGIGWTKILKQICNVDIEYNFTMPIYIKTNLAKYIPGNIMQFVGRNIIGNKYNIEQKKLALSTAYELIMLSTIGIAIILLTNQVQKIINFIPQQYILIIIIGFTFLLICCMILIRFKNISMNKTMVLEVANIFKVSIIPYLIALIFMGLSFVIIMLTVYEYDVNFIIVINWIGVFILGWFVGFITPGAPGGIGIREAVLIAYISKLIPSEYILEAVLIHRMISVISDVILYVLHILFYGKVGMKDEECTTTRKLL